MSDEEKKTVTVLEYWRGICAECQKEHPELEAPVISTVTPVRCAYCGNDTHDLIVGIRIAR